MVAFEVSDIMEQAGRHHNIFIGSLSFRNLLTIVRYAQGVFPTINGIMLFAGIFFGHYVEMGLNKRGDFFQRLAGCHPGSSKLQDWHSFTLCQS
jgi:hypothetical protein